MTGMEVHLREEGSETVIELIGRLDTTTSPQFEQAIEPILKGEALKVKVDCSRLDYVSSSGLRLFLMLQKNIKAKKGSLRLCGLNPAIREVFNVTGFSAIFRIE